MHRLGGDVSGSLVGKPIIIRSAARLLAVAALVPAPVARDKAFWAGGGTSSNKRSLK